MEQVKELKLSQKFKNRTDDSGQYKLQVINRGEQLYYEENDKAFICQILIIPKITLFTKSLKKWDSGNSITEEERNKFYNRIKKYFIESDGEEITFYDK